jgi:putative pyruvate formate lyase activating enzyme
MNEPHEPAYLKLLRSGELAERARRAREHLARCDLCARGCHVNRLLSTTGAVCGTGERATVYSAGPHHGEERPLSGWRGSGTIFFSWCSLACVFCQNWEINHRGEGSEMSAAELAELMLGLQETGCHNINFVTPSHVVAQVLSAVLLAAGKGLRLPLVWNSGGYDSLEALALLDGVIDIYLPDMKFADSEMARQYLGVKDYAEVNQRAVKEMHRQVGDLVLDNGIARRGLLVRHLILPENLAGTDRILAFLAHEISPDTYVNLMDQYRPCYRADEFPPLDRRPTRTEMAAARAAAQKWRLKRLDKG